MELSVAQRWASPSITTGSPASTVWRTRPVSSIPAYGVLRLRLARAPGSTVHVACGSTTEDRLEVDGRHVRVREVADE